MIRSVARFICDSWACSCCMLSLEVFVIPYDVCCVVPLKSLQRTMKSLMNAIHMNFRHRRFSLWLGTCIYPAVCLSVGLATRTMQYSSACFTTYKPVRGERTNANPCACTSPLDPVHTSVASISLSVSADDYVRVNSLWRRWPPIATLYTWIGQRRCLISSD